MRVNRDIHPTTADLPGFLGDASPAQWESAVVPMRSGESFITLTASTEEGRETLYLDSDRDRSAVHTSVHVDDWEGFGRAISRFGVGRSKAVTTSDGTLRYAEYSTETTTEDGATILHTYCIFAPRDA